MKVLLTGSAGFIGSHIAHRLLDRGDEVIGLDAFTDYYDPQLKERRNERLEERPGFQLIRGDIKDLGSLEAGFDLLGSGDETRVCHLAAQAGVRASIENPAHFIRDNVVAFGHLIELCAKRGAGGLIYASTSSVYGDNKDFPLREVSSTDSQMSVYGVTKKANELLASVYHNLYGLHSSGLRFFTVYGPWGRPDMALFLFTDAILRGQVMKIFGNGEIRRDFTYVDDIVDGFVAALDANLECEILNLGRGNTEELMDFVRIIEESCGKEGVKEFLPMQKGDVRQTFADIGKARELLGFEPKVSIAEGVPRFVAWYREYYGV
jgi:UDP-glucuronate 4-epimerase